MGTSSLVILAAGWGQRFGGAKQLAPVGPAGETLLAYTADGARRVGFEQVVIVTRPDLDAALRPLVDAASRPGGKVELVHQEPGRRGTVPAVLAARGVLDGRRFAVVNADDLYPLTALEALRAWTGPGQAVVCFHLEATILPGSGPVSRAVCLVDDDSRLAGLVETSVRRVDGRYVGRHLESGDPVCLAPKQLVSMNAWALDSSIWDHLEAAVDGPTGEVLLPVVIGALVAAGTTNVVGLPVAGSCIGITWPEELAVLRSIVAQRVVRRDLPARL